SLPQGSSLPKGTSLPKGVCSNTGSVMARRSLFARRDWRISRDSRVRDYCFRRHELNPGRANGVEAHQVAGGVPVEGAAAEVGLRPRALHDHAVQEVVRLALAGLGQVQPAFAVDDRVGHDLDDNIPRGQLLAGQAVTMRPTVHDAWVRVGDWVPGVAHVVPAERRIPN